MSDVITVIGDGQMGLVMADAFAARGLRPRVWGPFPDHVEALAANRETARLPGFTLPTTVDVLADGRAALEGSTLIVNAIPTQFIRPVWSRLIDHVGPGVPVVSVSKGIEESTLLRPTQVIADALGEDVDAPDREIGVLSGPTIAAELARHLPATMVVAMRDEDVAHTVQDACNVPWLRVYRHDDVIGVELAGATKNVIALAAGIVDGLEVGDNAKSALLARGLAEIARLGTALGARVDTFFGVAGVGDLATTCFSPEGRNRTCGERLGRGETLDQILESTNSVVEGVPTSRALREVRAAHGVDMPIAAAVHAILFEGKTPVEAIRDLMQRELKAEQIG
ncbi:MAG: NAD(P)H-dependent glycerol-3-phosphate dehydrogenase [Planctomycetota bacterium]